MTDRHEGLRGCSGMDVGDTGSGKVFPGSTGLWTWEHSGRHVRSGAEAAGEGLRPLSVGRSGPLVCPLLRSDGLEDTGKNK